MITLWLSVNCFIYFLYHDQIEMASATEEIITQNQILETHFRKFQDNLLHEVYTHELCVLTNKLIYILSLSLLDSLHR